MPNLIDIEKQLAFNSKTFIGTQIVTFVFRVFSFSNFRLFRLFIAKSVSHNIFEKVLNQLCCDN